MTRLFKTLLAPAVLAAVLLFVTPGTSQAHHRWVVYPSVYYPQVVTVHRPVTTYYYPAPVVAAPRRVTTYYYSGPTTVVESAPVVAAPQPVTTYYYPAPAPVVYRPVYRRRYVYRPIFVAPAPVYIVPW